ncbi:transmembrane protein 43 homolog isoform X2 [Drosophila busckii]|uniref:transmembrane protein 43 homolog isoform X2 n=1 Tax=Drosophila busckii TaxID=30019 RepID=UPI00083F04E7|nr:transmembrane protein 43 homolog isoform X2 [Drosophila busckii]
MPTLRDTFRANWLISVFGIILFLAGAGLLYWNEGRAVHTILALDEAFAEVYTMQFTEEEQDQSYEQRVVHLSGPILCGEPLTEPDYNIQIMAVNLRRRVQMYQWVEDSVESSFVETIGNVDTESTRRYYYTREWRDKLVDSNSFNNPHGHANPKRFPIESAVTVADAVFIGKYELGPAVKHKFTNYKELTSDIRPEDSSIKLHLGLYYHTNDVFNPEVGDLRLHFSYAGMEGEYYSVVGKLVKNKVTPYVTSRGVRVLLVYSGELSAAEMFKQEHRNQVLHTWYWRFVGCVLIFFGVTCNSKLLRISFLRVPLLLALAPDAQFPIGGNFIIAFSLALTIAAVAWILHRPVIGACLLLAGGSPYVWLTRNLVDYQRVD